jgi:hypothetical protein
MRSADFFRSGSAQMSRQSWRTRSMLYTKAALGRRDILYWQKKEWNTVDTVWRRTMCWLRKCS